MPNRPFLLVYDWACGQLVSLTELPDPATAAAAEREHADDESTEVSVVYGSSLDEVRREAVERRSGRTRL